MNSQGVIFPTIPHFARTPLGKSLPDSSQSLGTRRTAHRQRGIAPGLYGFWIESRMIGMWRLTVLISSLILFLWPREQSTILCWTRKRSIDYKGKWIKSRVRSISLFAQTRMTRKREAKQELPHSALRAGQARNPPFLSILWFPFFHVPQVDPVRRKPPSATTSRGERGTKRFRKVGIGSYRDIDLSAQQTLRISTFSPCFHFFHWNQFHYSFCQSKEGNATLIERSLHGNKKRQP